MTAPIQIAIVDNHTLFRQGMASLLGDFKEVKILFDAENGEDMIGKLKKFPLPDMILMDITMPVMNGYEATAWLQQNHPSVKVLALSMFDDDKPIIRMLKNGARGYILKESEPSELRSAINAVLQKGFYYSEMVTGRLVHSISGTDVDNKGSQQVIQLSDREIEFLKFACSEMTYKEIAAQMHLSPRTIEGYRDALFLKLDIKTRTGLVIYAIKNGIYKI